jgi:hypothetical protein
MLALAGPLAEYLEWRVTSVCAEGWLGLKNGPLLEAMIERELTVPITGDRTLDRERRRRLETLGIGVVVIRDPANAAARVEGIARAVVRVRGGELIEVA